MSIWYLFYSRLFTKGKVQLTGAEVEVEKSRKLSSVRIHIDRVKKGRDLKRMRLKNIINNIILF